MPVLGCSHDPCPFYSHFGPFFEDSASLLEFFEHAAKIEVTITSDNIKASLFKNLINNIPLILLNIIEKNVKNDFYKYYQTK